MKPVFEQTFFVSAGEANAEHELSLPFMTAKFIDIATDHANSLHVGNPDMANLNAGWVLSRLTIEMDAFPPVNSMVTISTWINAFNRHFSERSFKLSGEDGRVYGYARSIWMVMGTVSHQNVGLAHFNLPADLIANLPTPIQRQQKHIPIISPNEAQEGTAALIANVNPVEHVFQYSDLDSYRHVNTVRYIELLQNQYTLHEFDNFFIRRMELSFMREARYGINTQLLRNNSGLMSSFLLREEDDKTPLFFARIELKERL